jgi:exonuclease VII small subunit
MPSTWHARFMVSGARGRRETIRQLADLRRRLAVAEDALADSVAAMKRAEEAYDTASDHFDAAERVLDAAREKRAWRAASATPRARHTSRRAPLWTGSSGESASCPNAWTGCRSSRGRPVASLGHVF